jgi:hypothetical protein
MSTPDMACCGGIERASIVLLARQGEKHQHWVRPLTGRNEIKSKVYDKKHRYHQEKYAC